MASTERSVWRSVRRRACPNSTSVRRTDTTHQPSSERNRSIAGKVIVVTGASSGIGRETALLLGKQRARLVLVARRKDHLEQIRREVEPAGARVLNLPLDLTDRDAVHEMISRTNEEFGRIDVLINNAGFGFFGTVEKTPHIVVREIFALNFEAPLFASQLVIPTMRAQGNGQIINVGSVAGKRGLPLSGIYCATKFALDGLTQALRLEVKEAGIDVTLVNPAATRTEFSEHLRHGDVVGEFKSLGRIQSTQTVAAAIVRAIRNPAPEVYPYGFSRGLVWINATVPSLTYRLVKRALRDRIRAATANTCRTSPLLVAVLRA